MELNMKLHHTKYKNNYRNYILECLKTEDVFIGKKPTETKDGENAGQQV